MTDPVRIVGLCSAYKEGRLVRGAISSLERVGLDALLVYEGPAGEPLGDDVPESDYGPGTPTYSSPGRWRSDARKRDAMLQEAKKLGPGPTWGIWLDGDELLVGAEYVRDILQAVTWNDEYDGSGRPTIHWPLIVVESDASIAVTNSRLFRVDQVRSVDVSVSVVTNEHGVEEAWGNTNPDPRLWTDMWLKATETGRALAWKPWPGEPHIVHRSHLRHPLRRGLRMHVQEKDELRRAGKL